MPSVFRKFTLWDTRLIQTKKRALNDAEYEARKWRKKFDDLTLKHDQVHRDLYFSEMENISLRERLAEYEERDRNAAREAASKAASPTHPDTQIGRLPRPDPSRRGYRA